MKMERNSKCFCGSGKKYKNCHLNIKHESGFTPFNWTEPMDISIGTATIENGKIDFHKDHLIIKDYIEKKTYNLGSSRTPITISPVIVGNYIEVITKPADFIFTLYVDIPMFLPINELEQFQINIKGKNIAFVHFVKTRGQENFSTVDTNLIPNFSRLLITGEPFLDDEDYYESIIIILNKIFSFIEKDNKTDIVVKPILSYYVNFFRKADFINGTSNEILIAKYIHPYVGEIEIKNSSNTASINNEAFKNFLSQKIKIANYFEKTANDIENIHSFPAKVFLVLHDFIFYCTQHAEAISQLEEERIRDLIMIVFKTTFSHAEAEAFNFDGRTDFKITNPSNKYEFITGEFKWWNQETSFKDVFHQSVRKHFNGQEMEIHIIILSKNLDTKSVFKKCITLLKEEHEYKNQINDFHIPHGSKQLFEKHTVSNRGYEIPLTIGVANIYHKKL
jgi:hypothetical protein